MKKASILFLVFLSIGYSTAQVQGTKLIDSLKAKLNSCGEDTSKVRILGKLSFQYYKYDTDLGIYYGDQAIKLADKLHWGLGLAFSYNYLGTNYAVKGNYPKALEYFNKSLSKYTEINNKQGMAFLSNNLGNFYRIQKKYTAAIEFINNAISINKELNNKYDLVKNYNNLGSIYSETANFQKSNDYYQKALSLARKINVKDLVGLLLINLADNKTKMKDYCGALELSLEAIKISEELNITYDLAMNNGYVGAIYLEISNDNTNARRNCNYYSSDKRENLLSARKYLTSSINLLAKIDDHSSMSDNSLLLSQVYEKLGDNKNALLYYKKYSASKDSVFSKDKSIALLNIEKKREVELRDQKIIIQSLEIEKKNSQIIMQVVLFVLILVLTSLISYFIYKRLKKHKAAETELEKIKADKALLESEEQFHAVSEDSFNSIFIVNEYGKIIWANEAMIKLSGYPMKKIYAVDSFVSLLAPESVEFSITNFTKFLKGEEYTHHYEIYILRADGEKRLCEKYMSHFKDRNDRKNLVISMMDITERRKSEHELENYRNHLEELVKIRTEEWKNANLELKIQLERQKEFEMMLQKSLVKEQELNEMKSRFISTTSHEFRTPLTSILSSAGLIKRYGDRWGVEKRNDHIDRIQNSVMNLTKLLDEVLKISKEESEKINYNPEVIDLFLCAEECMQDAKTLKTNLHELKYDYQLEQKEFELDPKLLRFIFNNLLSNAIKYSPAGGQIVLVLSSDEKHILIKVSDEGIGIPKEENEKIFDSFYRTKNADEIKGTGLGLAIVKRAVDLHKGKIEVFSELGKGTTFSVTIPLKTN